MVLGIALVIIGPLATLVGIMAARYITASEMAPLNYVRLLLVGLLSPLWFQEPIDLLSVAGGALIVGACWLGIYKRKAT